MSSASSIDAVLPTDPQFTARATRAVMWNQALWTAGYSLTSGGFLAYFGAELGAKGFTTAVLLALPEMVGTVGLLTRRAIVRFGSRKRVWMSCHVAARLVLAGIPLLAFPALRPDGGDALRVLVGLLAVSQALGAIAYVSYLSWIADLVPERRWGRFFAWRNIAELLVLLVVPVAAGYGRDWWKGEHPELALYAYVAAFAAGILLMLLAMVPLLPLPDVPVRVETPAGLAAGRLRSVWRNQSLRLMLLHNWWLAVANGLTQAAFFGYLFGPLGVKLGTFYVLNSVMRLASLPVSWGTGRFADRRGNKRPLVLGLLAAGSALLFWLLATPAQWWWLFAAYFLWSGFAAVNIAGRNLVLKLAPPGDNALELGLFSQVAGLLAGLSGLAGALWLDALRESGFGFELTLPWVTWETAGLILGQRTYAFEAYQLLFLVSWVGRMTAILWVLPVREPPASARD